jgi:hypothetical protein
MISRYLRKGRDEMAGNGFTIIKVNDYTDDVMKAVEGNVKMALSLMGEVVEGHAKSECPVDTGLLRNSITHVTSGDSLSMTYHASYGSNRNKNGKRYGAGSMKAGSVAIGRISGQMGNSNDPIEYVGSNVEYAPYVEFGDRYHHEVGKAHFLRDAGMNHIDELKKTAELALSRV